MIRRLPLLPTALVVAAVATMIALGVWQLHRMGEKEALVARYTAAQTLSSEAAWPRDEASRPDALFRRSRLVCQYVLRQGAMAGRSAAGESGWAHTARCRATEGGEADVVLGWSQDPRSPRWSGGEVAGLVAPGGSGGARLIASPPLAGLGASARPDPRDIPNNHLAYAVQWFVFAAAAAVIYALALRKRGVA